MARIKGNKTPLLSFKLGASSAVDFGADVVKITWDEGDQEYVTLSDRYVGKRTVKGTAEFVLDFDVTKSYEYFYQNGNKDVTVNYRYDANTTGGQLNPLWSGTATLPPFPLFEIEESADVVTYEVEFQVASDFGKTAS